MIGIDHRNERVLMSDDTLDIVGPVVLGDCGERHLEVLSYRTDLGDLINKTAEATLVGIDEDRVVACSDRSAEIELLVDIADRNDLTSEIGKSREAIRRTGDRAHLVIGFDRNYLHTVKSITLISCRKNNLLSEHDASFPSHAPKPLRILSQNCVVVISATDQTLRFRLNYHYSGIAPL